MLLLIKKKKPYNKGEYWFYDDDLYLIEDIVENNIIITGVSKNNFHVVKHNYYKEHFFGGKHKSNTRWRKATINEIKQTKIYNERTKLI